MDSVEQLFRRHYAFVCDVIFSYVRDRSRTEDIAQELFAELWTKKEQLHIHTSAPAYLRRMAVSRALNYIRDSKKHKWEELDMMAEPGPGSASVPPDGLQSLEEAELQQRVNQAIEALPDKCRTVFLLNRREEMSYAEVASELGISVKTVENQIGKALRLLRIAVYSHRG